MQALIGDNNDVFIDTVQDMKTFMLKLLCQGVNHTDTFLGLTYQWAPYEVTETAQTRFFFCIELLCPKLYWYNPFHGMFTSKLTIICPMTLTCREVLVSLWRTRCSNPVIHAVFYDPATDECRLSKEQSQWAKQIIHDPTVQFDFNKLLKYIIFVYII